MIKRAPIKRVLIVNCYFDPLRIPVQRKFKFPQTMAPAYLAGVFSSRYCHIRLYDEVYSGPLEDEGLAAFPDMLVLTGLNVALDRMRHVTAYVKTKNPKAIVVAGGPAIRTLYHYSRQFFDYCCLGDLEQLAEIVEIEFGPDYLSEYFLEHGWIMPRFELAYWTKLISHVESSRYCYYHCNYCSLTAEKRCYRPYDLEYVRSQITALGPNRLINFLDNNFCSNNRTFMLERFELLKELRAHGYIRKWSAEVTCDFFFDEKNLELAAESGCGGLFCGIESFDDQILASYRKQQNFHIPQIELIQRCLEADIPFHYGIVFDFTKRTIDQLAAEWRFILSTPEIPLPSFVTLAIPLLKTPLFYECLENKLFLPHLRLRDLDGSTITLKSKNKLAHIVAFMDKVKNLRGYKLKILKHIERFYDHYKTILSIGNMAIAQYSAFLIGAPRLSTLQLRAGEAIPNPLGQQQQTFIGSKARLECVYKPAFTIDANYRHYFHPTPLTDSEGCICEALQPDLLSR